ncbi:helix-turn-helix domain-containing protein [Polymorphospora sp. NPDC050346]|uniref:MmyB family transcriptional regulator n=1 Tax=Polymorphospora sp. NPDC050346 TaxID=3155780 RepID=UPI0033C65352
MDPELTRRLLRGWRRRVTRAEVGLPDRLYRQRGKGLTQEDVAIAARYSLRAYQDLELGRRTPSPGLLDAVSQVLRLDEREQRALWLAATGTARPAAGYVVDTDPGLARLCDLLPGPAYVTDAAWNVLAANQAVALWFVDFSTLPPLDRNIAKWIFNGRHARHAFTDWEWHASAAVSRLRDLYAALPPDHDLVGLIRELHKNPEFAAQWSSSRVVDEPPTARRMVRPPGSGLDHPGVPLDMVVLVSASPADGRRAVAFLPPPGYTPPTLDVAAADVCPACVA